MPWASSRSRWPRSVLALRAAAGGRTASEAPKKKKPEESNDHDHSHKEEHGHVHDGCCGHEEGKEGGALARPQRGARAWPRGARP